VTVMVQYNTGDVFCVSSAPLSRRVLRLRKHDGVRMLVSLGSFFSLAEICAAQSWLCVPDTQLSMTSALTMSGFEKCSDASWHEDLRQAGSY